MTGWIILAVVVLLIVVISLIRLGGRVKYGPEGFFAYIMAGPFRIQLFPSERKKKTEKAKKQPKREKSEEQTQKKSGTVGRVLELLPTLTEALGRFKRKIRVDHLRLSVVWGAEDPASAAIGYGKANAFLGMIWPVLDNNFNIKKCDWQAEVDYNKTSPEFSADAAITITVGQLISFVAHYGVKIIMTWSRSGNRAAKQQEA